MISMRIPKKSQNGIPTVFPPRLGRSILKWARNSWTQRITGGAGEALRRALLLNPKQVEAHLHLGNLHLMRGRPGKAATVFQDALRIAPLHERLALALRQALEFL